MKAVNVDEVIKILYHYGTFLFIGDTESYSEMLDEIANLPSVQPKTKIGKWVEYIKTDFTAGYECSECGCKDDWKPNFCPNCGANMRGAK